MPELRSACQRGWLAVAALLTLAAPASALTSYATAAADDPGSSTGAAAVALGVPDYHFVNDAGLGFGGTSTDVFGPGESVVFTFPAALRNIPNQPDLLISAFVGGAGATDSAQVRVDVSSDGANFTTVATFDTAQGRNPSYYALPEVDFASVKHFPIEFGSADLVTKVRLTNLAGTAEGLRLDALEGLQPASGTSHAFEVRFEKYRDDTVERFLVRLKNISDPGGVPIHEFRIDKPAPTTTHLEDTWTSLYAQYAQPGRFLCVENCVPDNNPTPIPFSRHAWSLDGTNEAPAGTGLDPGRQAAHLRYENFDLDTLGSTFLAGFSFRVTFADGYQKTFTYSEDVLGAGAVGALFQKYLYFSTTPAVFGPRSVYTYEFRGPGRCSDGVDNDGDGLIDFPADPGCRDADDTIENPACNNGIDDDHDGKIDLLDPDCGGNASRRSEWPNACGLGAELALLLPLLARRWRSQASCASRRSMPSVRNTASTNG